VNSSSSSSSSSSSQQPAERSWIQPAASAPQQRSRMCGPFRQPTAHSPAQLSAHSPAQPALRSRAEISAAAQRGQQQAAAGSSSSRQHLFSSQLPCAQPFSTAKLVPPLTTVRARCVQFRTHVLGVQNVFKVHRPAEHQSTCQRTCSLAPPSLLGTAALLK
jgi:hypothetical protein